MSNPKHTVIVADDHDEFREGLRRMLQPRYDILAVVQNGIELLEAHDRLQADVVLVDLGMPRMGGHEAIQRMRGAGATTAIVVMTVATDREVARELISAGADAFVVKARLGLDLWEAMEAALRHETFVSPAVS